MDLVLQPQIVGTILIISFFIYQESKYRSVVYTFDILVFDTSVYYFGRKIFIFVRNPPVG